MHLLLSRAEIVRSLGHFRYQADMRRTSSATVDKTIHGSFIAVRGNATM